MNQFFKLSSNKLLFSSIAVASTAFVGSKNVSANNDRLYSSDQVREFDGRNGRPMFVTFRGGVYDVTEFKKEHPGGHFIEQAAGGNVEPFWQKWAYHYQSKKVWDALKKNRVGTLINTDDDLSKSNETNIKHDGAYESFKDDPKRTKEHIVLMERPFVSETTPEDSYGKETFQVQVVFEVF